MKALWFLPFTFAAGAEGFALFAPYLILLLSGLHLARARREARRTLPATVQSTRPSLADVLPDRQPAL